MQVETRCDFRFLRPMSSADEANEPAAAQPQVDVGNSTAPPSVGAPKDVTFKSLGVCQELCEACSKMDYREPTAIQQEAIPLALDGRDIIGLAQTGSGKTAAFAIPILQDLLNSSSGASVPSPFALVIAPTRELVFQIKEQFEALGDGIAARCIAIAGGGRQHGASGRPREAAAHHRRDAGSSDRPSREHEGILPPVGETPRP